MLRDQWQATNHDLTNRQQERHAQTQRDIAKRHEDTEKFARSIPGWTPETGQKIADFAQAEGVPFDALQANITPQLYSILYKAMLGAESLKKPAAVKPVAPLKPLTTVAAKTPASTPSKNPPSSMEDYVSWRKKQGYGAR
jgi:hypothetical protein